MISVLLKLNNYLLMKRVLIVLRHCLMNDEFSTVLRYLRTYNCLYAHDKQAVFIISYLLLSEQCILETSQMLNICFQMPVSSAVMCWSLILLFRLLIDQYGGTLTSLQLTYGDRMIRGHLVRLWYRLRKRESVKRQKSTK